jgi:predicted adenylyl cyclase CyaB
MGSNIEIKARVHDPAGVEERVKPLATSRSEVLRQEDVFFNCPHGRLKMRVLFDDQAELIHYQRPDEPGPAQSRYSICPVHNPILLRRTLRGALGEAVVVRKERRVYLIEQTRVHLDNVEGLGMFLELEVVLKPGQTPEEGQAIAEDLMRRLGIDSKDLVRLAYADLLLEKQAGKDPA